VDISYGGALGAPPFLRLTLTQPAYSDPPRDIPSGAKVAALGEAFAALLYERFANRPSLVRTRERVAAAFSRASGEGCIHDDQAKEVSH